MNVRMSQTKESKLLYIFGFKILDDVNFSNNFKELLLIWRNFHISLNLIFLNSFRFAFNFQTIHFR